MTGPIARILLRYTAAALVTYGLLDPEVGYMLGSDPDIALLLGTVIGAGTEALYVLAKKKGWAT